MNVVGIHYGLLLEAYLSAAPEHLTILMHSNTLLERCRAIRANLEPNMRLVPSFINFDHDSTTQSRIFA